MEPISQITRFRQSVVECSYKFSIQATMERFNVTRATVYHRRKRYDGSASSLMNCYRRPHLYQKQHAEIKLKPISDMRRQISTSVSSSFG